MSDAEVALELTKIILASRVAPVKNEKDPKAVILATYREAIAAVQGKEA